MDPSRSIHFDFYGLRVAVAGEWDDVLEDVRRDFSYFRSEPGEAALRIELLADDGPRDRLPPLKAALQTPRNTVYRGGGISYIDYFGRALAIHDARERRCEIHCSARDLAHEVAFLTLLSHVGQHLDAVGLHRVHALGVEAGGRAVLILLPMAGGKTTLALRLLRAEGVRLLSEDSPLISRRGEVFPFPIRIGVRVGGEPPGIPARFLRTVQRMEFGPKTLIDVECFRDRLGASCPAGAVLLGERWLAGPSAISPVPRRRALKPLVKNAVVGLGLYQGMEFVLERTAWEILGKAGVALSRLRNCLKLLRRSRVYRFALGPDIEQSAEVLAAFLRDFASPRSE